MLFSKQLLFLYSYIKQNRVQAKDMNSVRSRVFLSGGDFSYFAKEKKQKYKVVGK